MPVFLLCLCEDPELDNCTPFMRIWDNQTISHKNQETTKALFAFTSPSFAVKQNEHVLSDDLSSLLFDLDHIRGYKVSRPLKTLTVCQGIPVPGCQLPFGWRECLPREWSPISEELRCRAMRRRIPGWGQTKITSDQSPDQSSYAETDQQLECTDERSD